MSDAQLAIFMQLILTQLSTAIRKIEEELPEDMKIKSGGGNIWLDPLMINYPILEDLYRLENDISDGIKELTAEINKTLIPIVKI